MGEASVLGLAAFVHVAGIREREQRRRGKEMDAQVPAQGPGLEGENGPLAGTAVGHSGPAKNKASCNELLSGAAPSGSSAGSVPPLIDQDEAGGITTETDNPGMFIRVVISHL
jgi:hypothetical protein